jgi:DHA1 family tetracycline resistance protein-like MFS transporter
MQETRKSEEAVRIKWDQAIWNILDAFKMKKLRIVFLTNFLFQAGLTLFATFFAVFLTNTFGYDQVAVGYYIAYAGIWVIISQGFVLRYLVRFFDEITLLRVFLLAGALSVFLYYIPEHTIGLLIVGACFALTNGITMASLPSLASRLAPAHKQGEIMGLNTSVQALAQAIPPVIAGFLAAEITPSAPVYAAGAVIFLGWIVFVVGVKRA